MDEKELKKVLEKHMKWLLDEDGGERADLCGANLYGANLYDANLCDASLCDASLCGADLRGANLSGANLSGANLCGANLRGVNLYCADLRGADLRGANLCGANLCGANLRGVNLYCANLRGANLYGANLYDANLRGADLRGATGATVPYSCPDFGMFIGWKKARGYIIQLEIPENAKRLSTTGRKCRCDKAKVLSIQNPDGSIADVTEVASSYRDTFVYKVGEIVSVDDFDEDRWNECSTGIHFFINRQEAVDY